MLDQILVMLHPFMPFVTEELWHALGDRPYDLIHAKWPQPGVEADAESRSEIDWLTQLVGEIRTARTELNVPPSAKLRFEARSADASTQERLARNGAILARLARVERGEGEGAQAQIVIGGATIALFLGDAIDLAAERERLTKGMAAAAKERDALMSRLANPSFVERAKPEAVAKAHEDHRTKAAEVERLEAALARLAG